MAHSNFIQALRLLANLNRANWCWERLKAEGDSRGRDGWMASPTQRAWIWASFGTWWRTGKPGVLQSMRSQRAGHNWATEHNNNMPRSEISVLHVKSLRLCPTLQLHGLSSTRLSVHGILQARILERVAIFFSRGSSWARDWTYVSYVSCIVTQVLYH